MKDVIAKSRGLIKRGNYKKAKDILIAYCTVSRSAEAFSLLAISYIFLNDFTAADIQIEKALKYDPSSSDARLAKAYISLNSGHRENALREYFSILDIEPENKMAKSNIERIRFLTNSVKSQELRPRDYLIYSKVVFPKKILATVFLTVSISVILYFTVNLIYPVIKYRILNKEQMALRKKLEAVYLFEGLEKDKIPESAKSATYSPKQVADLFDKAKKNIRGAEVNSAVMIINSALQSDINEYLKERFRVLKSFIIAPDYTIFKDNLEYLTVVSNPDLYNSGFVKWKAEVLSVSKITNDGITKNKARILVYNSLKNKIDGIADIITEESITLTPKKLIEVYAKVDGYDNKEHSLQLTAQVIKHLPNN